MPGFPQQRLASLVALLILFVVAGAVSARAQQAPAIQGTVWFDRNANGQRDANEPVVGDIFVEVEALGIPGSSPARPRTSVADGRYTATLFPGPGRYRVQAVYADVDNNDAGPRLALASPPRVVEVTKDLNTVDLGVTVPASPHDERYFVDTGYRIDNDTIWTYFVARGGLTTFGYPVSRTFQFGCCWVQFFQRYVVQATAPVGALNLLDPDLLPITSVNGSTVPAHDPLVAATAPTPHTADYGQAVLHYLEAAVPDRWDGRPVQFLHAYMAAAGGAASVASSEDALTPLEALSALELWGFPTSQPAEDPSNRNFVYQRFQRGILQYDATTDTTGGLLLADVFKEVLTGQHLSSDVALQMANSPYLRAWSPNRFAGATVVQPPHILASLAFTPS